MDEVDQSAPPLATEHAVAVRIYTPSIALQPYVTFFYFVEVGGELEDFLYPEWGNVRFAIAGEWDVRMAGFDTSTTAPARLFGPTDRPGRIRTGGGKTIGFGMTPLGWHRLLGANAADMANRIVPLETRMGFAGDDLCRTLAASNNDADCVLLMEQAVLDRLATRPEIGQRAFAADRALRMRPAEVVDFARATGLSLRTLHRVCLEAFGFAPKRLMRLQRFLDTLGQVRSAVGSPLKHSIDDAYCDQSHFYRDFRDFMGMTPRAYFRSRRRLMAAAAMAQARAGVTLSFRLPPPPDDAAPDQA